MSEKLLPCFKCGSANLYDYEDYIEGDDELTIVIGCNSCGVKLETEKYSMEEAVKAWNARAMHWVEIKNEADLPSCSIRISDNTLISFDLLFKAENRVIAGYLKNEGGINLFYGYRTGLPYSIERVSHYYSPTTQTETE